MPRGQIANSRQNWQPFQNHTNNGFLEFDDYRSPSLGNIVNGYWPHPIAKIVGAIPSFKANRSMPLKMWELVEIHWKDFSQEVGQIQGYGWKFTPHLYDAYNSLVAEQSSAASLFASAQSASIPLSSIAASAAATVTAINAEITDIPSENEVTLSLEGIGTDEISAPAQVDSYANDNPFPTTVAALKGQLAEATEAASIATVNYNLMVSLENSASAAASSAAKDIANNYSNMPIDELGLTDDFMHAIYTEFLKRFWGYRIGQSNIEMWWGLLNTFLGNYLPMRYKAARNLALSDDFATTQWSIGNGTISNLGTTDTNQRGSTMGDGLSHSQQDTNNAAANTPQNRMKINARNIDFANSVQNQEDMQQSGQSQTQVDRQDNSQKTSSNTLNNNSSNQYQLDPLGVWEKVINSSGLFEDLWQKAIAYGLFDLTM